MGIGVDTSLARSTPRRNKNARERLMKIIDIQTKTVQFHRRKFFKIAFGKGSNTTDVVYVKVLTDEGLYGLGEASPAALVTGETVPGVICAVEYLKPRLLGLDPLKIEEIHQAMDGALLHNTAAKAAIDIACYDLFGKAKGTAVHTLLGAKESSFQTDITIGIDTEEEMAREAKQRCSDGFRCLKIKCGINPEKDLRALEKIRAAVGEAIELRVDINQGYDEQTALSVLKEMKKLNIMEAEQPVPFYDVHAMARIRALSPIPIMADESVHTPKDAEIVCEHNACDILNIKLMKCGGIYPALQISEIAKKYGKNCIVGCMSESKLAISAAATVLLSKDNVHSADLDSFFSFTDPERGVSGGFTAERDVITMSEKPGFGVELDEK